MVWWVYYPLLYAVIALVVSAVLRFAFGCYLVGLTGGIATGKSTCSRYLMKQNAYVIDFDQIVREIQEPGGRAFNALHRTFGKSIIGADGKLDRAALGALVFGESNRANLSRLNALMRWPILRTFFGKLLTAIFIDRASWIVLDIPLLFERGFQRICDETVLVYVSPAVQRERLMSRDHFDGAEADRRIAAQWPIDKKRALATEIITNESDVDAFHSAIDDWKRRSERRFDSRLMPPRPTPLTLVLAAAFAGPLTLLASLLR